LTPRPTGLSITDTHYRPSALATVSQLVSVDVDQSVNKSINLGFLKCPNTGNGQSAESEWVKLKEVVAETAAKTLTKKRIFVKKRVDHA